MIKLVTENYKNDNLFTDYITLHFGWILNRFNWCKHQLHLCLYLVSFNILLQL